MSNPLLESYQLPPFNRIEPQYVRPALTHILRENKALIEALLQSRQPYTWNNLMEPLENLSDHLEQMWSPVGHLHAVMSTEEWRDAYQSCLEDITQYHTELAQNKNLYDAIKSIEDSPAFSTLTIAQQKLIKNELRDFHLSGVDLPREQKERYQQLQAKHSQLITKFEEHILDATHAFSLHLDDEAALSGVPDAVKALAKANAIEKKQTGFLLTLDAPCYVPIMQYANDRSLRKKMYDAYVTRASDQGDAHYDNSALMVDILQTRLEIAHLLGFKQFVDYALVTKMAQSVEEVLSFLEDLRDRVKPKAQSEMQALREFAKKTEGITDLEPWDIAYYSEKLRVALYDYSAESLRVYFPEERVLQGLFSLLHTLYGITVHEVRGIETWHSDVRFFEVRKANVLRGYFYMDLYARDKKRGGAWMDSARPRRRLADGVQVPVAYVICNFMRPLQGQSALFTHEEVETLFHEVGHCLHHVLTQVDVPGVSGIQGVAWDAVELPSQFMENFCWNKEVIHLISAHHLTGEPLPDALFEKMLKAKNFQCAMQLARQLEFALFDIKMHREVNKNWTIKDIQHVLDQVRREIAVVPIAPYNRFQHSFSHIFAGGYAAGYYSYLWAEVLSSDAFSRFEEEGLFNPVVGQAFLNEILEKGGSEPMDVLFKRFRGRPVKIDALLRHRGLS